MNDLPIPTYEEVKQVLQHAGVAANPAETHGIISGFVCVGYAMDGKSWLEPILGGKLGGKYADAHHEAARETLLLSYQACQVKLQGMDLDFELLLPDDDAPLMERAQALSHWCQGFLVALNYAQIDIKPSLSEDAKEALTHIEGIAQLDYEDMMVEAEDEAAYYEVMEYIRMAILMIYTDVATEQGRTGTSSHHKLLH